MAEIAGRDGIDRLHRRELGVLRLTLRSEPAAVITAAASVAERPDVKRSLLSRHWVVAPWAPPRVLVERPPRVLVERA